MGLIEQARYYGRRSLDGFLRQTQPGLALEAFILDLEQARLHLEQALLQMQLLEGDLERRRRHNDTRIAQREREIKGALARDADGNARRAIHGKRELIEIERELEAERLEVQRARREVETELVALIAKADEAKRTRRTWLLADRPEGAATPAASAREPMPRPVTPRTDAAPAAALGTAGCPGPLPQGTSAARPRAEQPGRAQPSGQGDALHSAPVQTPPRSTAGPQLDRASDPLDLCSGGPPTDRQPLEHQASPSTGHDGAPPTSTRGDQQPSRERLDPPGGNDPSPPARAAGTSIEEDPTSDTEPPAP